MRQAAWEAATLRLLDDVYAFAATGPRTQAGWPSDALAVMNRAVADPRGWLTLDWDEKNTEKLKLDGPSFPFLLMSPETMAGRLNPVTVETAARLLVIMTYEWERVGPDGATVDAPADARTLLGRYGGGEVSYYSNISAARTSPSPDLTAGVNGWTALTSYVGDCGIVVVSPEEVGVFWSFDAH